MKKNTYLINILFFDEKNYCYFKKYVNIYKVRITIIYADFGNVIPVHHFQASICSRSFFAHEFAGT